MEFPCGNPLFRGQNVGCECEKKRSFPVRLVPKSGKQPPMTFYEAHLTPRAPLKFLPGQVHQILHTQPTQSLIITWAYNPIRRPQPGSHLNSMPRHSPAHSSQVIRQDAFSRKALVQPIPRPPTELCTNRSFIHGRTSPIVDLSSLASLEYIIARAKISTRLAQRGLASSCIAQVVPGRGIRGRWVVLWKTSMRSISRVCKAHRFGAVLLLVVVFVFFLFFSSVAVLALSLTMECLGSRNASVHSPPTIMRVSFSAGIV